jgi:transcriptional regulator with XRE-family HTH domain
MRETARIMTSDPQARLAVLLATTGLTQVDLAKLLRVAGRTVRRWMQGVCTPPAVAIEELEALARTLDEDADFVVRAMGEEGSAAALLVYRRDFDVPPSRGLIVAKSRLSPSATGSGSRPFARRVALLAAITSPVSYSAKFLKPFFLVTASSSALYLALACFENTAPCIFSTTAEMSFWAATNPSTCFSVSLICVAATCAGPGREAGKSNGHSRNGETKHLIHSRDP